MGRERQSETLIVISSVSSLSPESAAINTGDFLITQWREYLPGECKRAQLRAILCTVDAIYD